MSWESFLFLPCFLYRHLITYWGQHQDELLVFVPHLCDLSGVYAGFQQPSLYLSLSTFTASSCPAREAPVSACLHEEDGCSADTTELMVSLTHLTVTAVLQCEHAGAGAGNPPSPIDKAAHYIWTLSHLLWTNLLSVWMGSQAFFNAAIYWNVNFPAVVVSVALFLSI